jgi:hypothetical protein
MPTKYVKKTDRVYRHHKMTFEPGFLAKLDRRTEVARLLRERFDGIAADLGGQLSGIQASLLERFVFLEASLMKLEAEMAKAKDAKTTSEIMARWTQACNALLGIGRTLGLERQMKALELDTYLATHNDGAGGVDDK